MSVLLRQTGGFEGFGSLLVQTHSLDLSLRARMEARVEATDGNRPQQALTSSIGEVVDLREVREAAQ